jgi:hypothetical protein
MKKIALVIVALVILPSVAFAGHVNGYSRRDGTYVQGYERSNPNQTVRDNYSYSGNTNPYTGSQGSNRYHNSESSEYYDPSR